MQLALSRHLGRHVQQSGSDGPIAAGIQPAQMDIDMSLWLAIQRLKTPAKLAKRRHPLHAKPVASAAARAGASGKATSSASKGYGGQGIRPAAQQTRRLWIALNKLAAVRIQQGNTFRRLIHQRLITTLAVRQRPADGLTLAQLSQRAWFCCSSRENNCASAWRVVSSALPTAPAHPDAATKWRNSWRSARARACATN